MERKREKEWKNGGKLTMKSQLPNIPDGIVLEILSRLPERSLMRFRCVSKPWCAWISNPKFSLSIRTGRRLVIASSIPDSYSVCLQSLAIDDLGFVEELREPWDGAICGPARILGSCDGLLLISCYKGKIFLWNPSTMDYKKVSAYIDLTLKHFVSGLCYDSSTSDYKVVIGGAGYYHVSVLVTSVQSHRVKKVPFPYDHAPLQNSGPLVNGYLHWMVAKNGETIDTIINFDPVKDEFGEVPIPRPNSGVEKQILGLGELAGCLAIARWENNYEFKVLAMKNYCVEETWTTLFSISNFRQIKPRCYMLEPLCTTRDGEVLMAVAGEEIMAYNPKEGTHRSVLIPRKDYRITSVLTYVESRIKLSTRER